MNGEFETVLIPAGKVDPSVLDRISEADVAAWLAARLAALRAAGTRAHNISCNVRYEDCIREEEADYGAVWTLHGGGKVAMHCRSVDVAAANLLNKMLDNPAGQARAAREKARELMKEADEIERSAASGARRAAPIPATGGGGK